MRRLDANEIEPERGTEVQAGPEPPLLAPGPAQVLALQRAAGNQVVAQLVLARRRGVAIAPGTPLTPGGPVPATPASGVDWEAWFDGSGPARLRTVMELGRAIPGFGFFFGGVSDVMNAAQDVLAIDEFAPPELQAALYGRHAVATFNNALGSVIYCIELVQDIATASVVGTEIDAVTAPLNAFLLAGKIAVDGAMGGLDLALMCVAKYNVKHPMPAGDEGAKAAWQAMVDNYEANVVGDVAAALLDAIDLTTLGFANVKPMQAGLRAVKELWDVTGSARGAMSTVLQGWFNVWGGSLMGHAGGVEGISQTVAGGHIWLELQRMKACYQVGDLLIGEASEYVAAQMAELEQGAELVLGGRDPFITARDAAVDGLAALEAQIADIGEMGALSSTAAEKAAAVEAACTEGLELLDTVQLPELDVPETDLGEGAAADLAEGALDMAGGIAEAGIDMALGQLQAQIDLVKDALRAPLETMRENAVAFGEFMQLVSEEAAVQLAVAEERAERIRGRLAGCESLEDIIDTLIDQILETVGLHAGFEVDDLRQAWGELGVTIDEAIVWAEALRDGREAQAPVVADAEPIGLGHEDQDDDQDRR